MEFYTMNFLSVIIIQVIWMANFSFVQGGCPDYRYIGPRTKGGNSICAKMYDGTNCDYGEIDAFNGELVSDMGHWGWNDRVGSIVVREGCTYHGYWSEGYTNADKFFTGGVWYLNLMHIGFGDWADDLSSYSCDCIFPPVDCTPVDEWKQLASCTNNLDSVIQCEYSKSHGFHVSISTTVSVSIEKSIGLELKAVFGVAEAGGSASLTTGYSWTQ
ncbi:unnamed protein product [Meganyctiphanes norvegica]|uniref:Uncharacterized protein n=1 Tax=Meganyctiphanes norvegica TaxID=48144 RepID=A0AAV2Q6L2_MEGNR